MSKQGEQFAEALAAAARTEAVSKGFSMAIRNLLAEINSKPLERRTDAESTFANAFAAVLLIEVLAIGGNKL